MNILLCLGKKHQLILNSIKNNFSIGLQSFDTIEDIPQELLKDAYILAIGSGVKLNSIDNLKADCYYKLIIGQDRDISSMIPNFAPKRNCEVVTLKTSTVLVSDIKELVSEFIEQAQNLEKGKVQPTNIDAKIQEQPKIINEDKPVINENQIEEANPGDFLFEEHLTNPIATANATEETYLQLEKKINEQERLNVNLYVKERTLVEDIKLEIKNAKSTKERILKLVDYYMNTTIAFISLPKSFTTTLIMNIGNYLSGLGIPTLIVDLNTQEYNLGSICQDNYKELKKYNNKNNFNNALKNANIINNSIQLNKNLFVLSAYINQNSIDLVKRKKELYNLIDKHKNLYKVILFDMKFEDTYNFEELVLNSDNIIINLRNKNSDYLKFMRYCETSDQKLRDKYFKLKCCGYVDIGREKKLLKTDKSDISALEVFMRKELNRNNPTSYSSIEHLGHIDNISKDNTDYLEDLYEYDKTAVENIILRSISDFNEES